jgi:hypothetical protein
MRHSLTLLLLLTAAAMPAMPAAQSSPFMPVSEVRAGMVGTGRTVYAGGALEEFRATILGVLQNAVGPRRDIILARLEGGPLANTGVIQGMSGSPVYIDGRLVGAVSYSLGSFPKEPLAGITPITEMTEDVASTAPRVAGAGLSIDWPAPPEAVFAAIERVARRAMAPLGGAPGDLQVVGPQSLADLAPTLRPIGAAVVVKGFEPLVGRQLQSALTGSNAPAAAEQQANGAGRIEAASAILRPGDPVGMSLMRGDLEMGATGTVTHVDGNRVYAFGHPFLNLGPASMAMTRAHIYTVLPSLSSSMKIASLGEVIGTITQDRATAVGGLLGPTPSEMAVRLTLSSDRAPAREFNFFVLHDASLTPLFSYVALLNSFTAYERQTGVTSITATGTIAFDTGDTVTIDDVFTGDTAATSAAGAVSAPIGAVVANQFRAAMPERLDLKLHITETQRSTTIERVWLDTTRPELGGSYRVQVQLQDYRGGKRTVSVPITMPTHAQGPVTLLVTDAASLTELEQRELEPARPTSWPALIRRLNDTNRNNTLYVRLIQSSSGTVVGGDTLPDLPASVQSVLRTDATVARSPVAKAVVGEWEERLDLAVNGSRELVLTLQPRR